MSTAKANGQTAPPTGWADGGSPRQRIRSAGCSSTQRVVAWLIYRVVKIDAANLFSTLMQHWRLFFPWLAFAARLVPYGTLPRQDTELAVLRVAWNCRARYEWCQHVDIAMRAGVPLEAIAQIPEGPEGKVWNEREATLLAAVDQIHQERQVSDKTWHQLTAHYTHNQLLELCMLVGHYEMIATVINTFHVPLDLTIERKISAFHSGSRPLSYERDRTKGGRS
jgi:alkylhydroperoxidase family enzyme